MDSIVEPGSLDSSRLAFSSRFVLQGASRAQADSLTVFHADFVKLYSLQETHSQMPEWPGLLHGGQIAL